MIYKYCNNQNFSDLSSGKVIRSKSGYPNFPVRLSQEIFCRCKSYLKKQKNITIYDPCCGNGYMLTVIGFLNLDSITNIIASDVNSEAVDLAKNNLELLTIRGIESRIKELKEDYKFYEKTSHLEAIKSAICFKKRLLYCDTTHNFDVFVANILLSDVLTHYSFKTDIVITDVPYGNLVLWEGSEVSPINKLFQNIYPILSENAIIAVCSDKRQKISVNNYTRLEKQIIGKRKFEIYANW